SFAVTAAMANESENNLESTAGSEEGPNNASWELYLERKNSLLGFLHSQLDPQLLQYHQSKVEHLKRCYFYLEIEPKQTHFRDNNNAIQLVEVLRLIDPWELQKMKQLGKTQTEIQLSLLTELLEQLERGREELSCYAETCEAPAFLAGWHWVTQRVSELLKYMETLVSVEVPGKLYVKQQLVSHSFQGGLRLPSISLSLSVKTPPIFDPEKSSAQQNSARLQWFTENQESDLDQYELECELLIRDSRREMGYGRIQTVTSNTCVVHGLEPGRSYKFKIRRSDTGFLVYAKWFDSIVLTTK
ncbi:Uncharacterized protein C20orf195, partial [Pterocles gutturalis]